MDRLRPYPVAVFCALTLAIWGNRIWLAWTNDEDSVGQKLLWTLPITVFVVVALVLGATMLARVDRSSGRFVSAVRWFAGATIVYWAVRAPMIIANDHDLTPSEEVAFKVVHTVLAAVSMAAAAWAWRSVATPAPEPSREDVVGPRPPSTAAERGNR